jgi:hypothetical protein
MFRLFRKPSSGGATQLHLFKNTSVRSFNSLRIHVNQQWNNITRAISLTVSKTILFLILTYGVKNDSGNNSSEGGELYA